MKLLMWTLIEINTVLLVAIIATFYFWHKEKKVPEDEETPTEEPQNEEVANSSKEMLLPADLDELVAEQLQYATQELSLAKKESDDKRVTLTKLWGTLLKAERKILSEDADKTTEPVLKQLLGPILQAIFDSKSSKDTLADLEKKLDRLVQETSESHMTLEVKEELEKVQNSLRQTLQDEIAYLEEDAEKLKAKYAEHTKLEANLAKAHKNLEKFKKQLESIDADGFDNDLFGNGNNSGDAASKHNNDAAKHSAVKQIEKLTKLYERQQNVIDLLKGKIDGDQGGSEEENNEAAEVGLLRLERLVQESDTLIIQLEAELSNSELENNELKENLVTKSAELKSVTEKLLSNKKTALGSLKENTQANQDAISDLKSSLDHESATPEIVDLVQQQANELSTIERLLQESETCVTLLEQELETAKNNNIELLKTVEEAEMFAAPQQGESAEDDKPLEEYQQEHHDLLSAHREMKKKLLNVVSDDDEMALRSDYNKKNLELDRLQLAVIDLEKKHLKLTATANKPA